MSYRHDHAGVGSRSASTTQAAGSLAHTDVAPTAFMSPSKDPAYPGGFTQQASNEFGVPTGTTTSYTISVPSAGTTTSINTTTGGCSTGENGTVRDPTGIPLQAGTQTVTLTTLTGGYYLRWFSLTRE